MTGFATHSLHKGLHASPAPTKFGPLFAVGRAISAFRRWSTIIPTIAAVTTTTVTTAAVTTIAAVTTTVTAITTVTSVAAITTVTTIAGRESRVEIDKVDESGDFGPNCGRSWIRANSIAVRRHAHHDVPAVRPLARDGSARITHAASDVSIAEANLILLLNAMPSALAIFELPDFGSNGLQTFVPVITLTLHRESPTRNVTKLTLIVLPLLGKAGRSYECVVEIDRLRHLQESDVVGVGARTIPGVDEDLGDAMFDFIRIFSVDIVIADSDHVRRWVSILVYAMSRRQHPVLAQDGSTAAGIRAGTLTLVFEVNLPRPLTSASLMTTDNSIRGTFFAAFWPSENEGGVEEEEKKTYCANHV